MLDFQFYFSLFLMFLLFFIGFFIEEMSNRAIYYGVRVPLDYKKNLKLKKVKSNYRRNYVISSVLFWGLYFVLTLFSKEYFPLIMVLGTFSFLIVLNINYYIAYRQVKEIKNREKWVLSSDRVVVVDMKFREKDKNNKRIVISPLWFLIPIGIPVLNILTIIFSRNKFESSLNVIILTQVGATILFFSIYKLIEKSKQQLNGGEINEIKYQSRVFRYVTSALILFFSIIFNISYFITTLSLIGIVTPSERSTLLIMILLGLLPILVSIIVFGFLGQNGRYLKYKGEVRDDKLVINRDDDDNYIMGTMYYNKHDPALIVDKRVGIGWSFNLARPAAKVILGGVAAIIIFTIILVARIPGFTTEREITITEESIEIDGTWGVTVEKEEIEKVTLETVMPNIVAKTNGAGIGNKQFGYYSLREYNKSSLFIMDKTKPFISIYKKDNSLVLINYEEEEKTKKLYNEIVNALEGK